MVTVAALVVIIGVLALLFRMKPKRLRLKVLKIIELSAEADSARDEDKPLPSGDASDPPAVEVKELPEGKSIK
jgi:hypothetical protein